jgi:hypothetical protein
MPELPFSQPGINLAVSLAALWLILETFNFRPFAPRPPWRSPFMELCMWLLLGANTILVVVNIAVWFALLH